MDLVRKAVAERISPDIYVNEENIGYKINEFLHPEDKSDVSDGVDEFSQNLWNHFLGQENNLTIENDTVRLPDNIKKLLKEAIDGGLEKERKQRIKQRDSLSNKMDKMIDQGKEITPEMIDELDTLRAKVNWLDDTLGRIKKANTGKPTVFNEYDFFMDEEGTITPLSGLSSFTVFRDKEGKINIKDKYDFYSPEQTTLEKVVTLGMDNILGKPFPIADKFKDGGEYNPWYPSDSLIDFLIKYEGFEPTPRIPSKGDVLTTGFGVTDKDIVKKNMGKEISRQEAMEDFRLAIDRRVEQFVKATPNFDKLNDNQRDALFSYFYNIGYGGYVNKSKNLQKALTEMDLDSVVKNIDFDYNNKNRKGAIKRRNAEREMFNTPVSPKLEESIGNDKNILLDKILGSKNNLELQDSLSTTRGEAFRDARRKGLKEFTWNGKKYNTNIKKDGGPAGGSLIDKQYHIYGRLVDDYHIPEKQAIAIIANLTHESGLNVGALGDSGASYGIQQWKGKRRTALEDFAKKRGSSTPTLDDQIDFLMEEYNNGRAFQFNVKGQNLFKTKGSKGGISEASDYYQFSKADFDNADNLYDATIAWNQGVGRPHKKWAMNDRRYQIAKNLAKVFNVKDDGEPMFSEQGYVDINNHINGLPNVDVVAERINDIDTNIEQATQTAEENSKKKEFFELYGKDLLAQLLAYNPNRITQKPEEQEQEIKNNIQQEKDDSRQKLIAAFLPNIQLNIKGVTEIHK